MAIGVFQTLAWASVALVLCAIAIGTWCAVNIFYYTIKEVLSGHDKGKGLGR